MFKWKKYMVAGLVMVVLLSGIPVWAKEPAETELYAKAAVLMDAASGRVLYEKNGDEVLSMASTTKILTCIVALETTDLEEVVDISAYAASMPKVKLSVQKGEQYRLGDLLYSLMLESHNDSAVAVAEAIGGDVDRFCRLMDKKAEAIGCDCVLVARGHNSRHRLEETGCRVYENLDFLKEL